MRAKEIRERSDEELLELERRMTRDLFQMRFRNFTNRLDDTSQVSKARRDLARVKTVLRERALTAAAREEGTEA